jgi:hypothetical protein
MTLGKGGYLRSRNMGEIYDALGCGKSSFAGYGFTGPRRNNCSKILVSLWARGKLLFFRNSLGFQAQIEDLRLNCFTLRENSNNKTSGRSHWQQEVVTLIL